MSDRDLFLIIGLALMLLQWLYRVWDKKDNKAILNVLTEDRLAIIAAIEKAVSSFGPHLERTRKTHGIVKSLKELHDVRDDDGRLMWFTPKETIETTRELVKLTHTIATSQKHITETQRTVAKLLERQELSAQKSADRIESMLIMHGDSCKGQWDKLDKKISQGD